MINGTLKAYTTTRDSGLPWLGEIPTHWHVRRGKELFGRVDVRSTSGEEELLTVSSERGVVPRRSANVTMFKAESYAGYKLCWPGDLVINSLWAWARGLGVSQYHGIVSSAYGVYRTRRGFENYAEFAHHLVRSQAFQWELQVRSKGIWKSRLQLTDESFLDAPFPLPPADEQSAIVHFLEHIGRRIRRSIRAKQKLIKLLEEQKRTVTHCAVTRGLDPAVHLKPSGVEWLGDVPEHWEVIPNRALLRIRKHLVGNAADEYTLLSLTKRGVIPRDLENPEGKFPTSFETYQSVETDDLIFCLFDIDETPRAVGLATTPGMVTGAYTRFECTDPKAVQFVYLFYLAMDNDKRLKPLYTGLRKVINKATFLSAKMPLPPVSERREIVDYIRTQSDQAGEAVQRAQREIALLIEYRDRITADLVTGKVDVRHAVESLPHEVDADEELDGSDDLGDSDEQTGVDDFDAAIDDELGE